MFNLKHITSLKHNGDTIVEVLICLAIVSGGLTISYGTARRSLFQIRDAQERGEMLSLSQTELELLKSKLKNDTGNAFYNQVSGFGLAPSTVTGTITNRSFCITEGGLLFAGITDPRSAACAVNQNGQFYMDFGQPGYGSPPPTSAAAIAIVDQTHPYRTGIIYHPHIQGVVPASHDDYNFFDEWYIFGGRFGAGGYGNQRAFSVVPLMYRQHPNL